jgi:peptidyl-prolyl cis-trans isomerase B (cyclophilin B)
MKKALLISFLLALAAGLAMAQAPKAKGGSKSKGAPAKAQKAETPSANEVAVLETKLGKIVIKFFPDKAPNHVKNFKELCKSGFYNGTRFHRIIPGFMIQGGDPNTKTDNRATWGQGGNVVNGKENFVKAEFNDIKHIRGIVSMARSGQPDSASSQFFICVADANYLDGQYTVFGEVVEGMDVVDKIVSAQHKGDQAVDPVAIVKAKLEKAPSKAAAPKTQGAKAEPKPAKVG